MTDFKKLATVALTIMLVQGVLALLISSAASAQESLMITLDNDRDGLISLREATGHRTLLENFNKIDSNEDGYISLDELEASQISKG
ncbi:calcium-binding EF-hand protein [Brumicola nitratireducens]|uniref:Calcium-binding EF-hand protein n=1 Tax=Glaciecola nitratireducens (strain JCM 12485 / KCTC 12276 / FR1064) TaxID=1085623 RepID=G4QGE5_GLANF|nr:calcium-binding EF-hand protein [Glaciecola nitratireducens]AEP29470.1 calcium-binding EF-hand protein [Glaciecola nitratireducens FR1064]